MGLIEYDLYQSGRTTLLSLIAMVCGAALMPYLVTFVSAFLVVPPDYAGASVKRLYSRHRSETGEPDRTDIWGASGVIQLMGFRGGERFALNPGTGAWAVLLKEDALSWDSSGCSGDADLRLTALWGRKVTLVALFVDAGKVWLRVGSQTFDLTNPSIRVVRRSWIPFVRMWRVYSGADKCLALSYYWADIHEWPDDEDVDIFFQAAVMSASSIRIERFVKYWSLVQSGKSADEIATAMDKVVRMQV